MEQTHGRGILLRGLRPGLADCLLDVLRAPLGARPHRRQRSLLLIEQSLELAAGDAAGSELAQGLLQLRTIVAGNQAAAEQGAGQQDQQHGRQEQSEPAHDSTALARCHNARRSAWPFRPPLMRRVMAANSPRSASSLSP